MKIKVETTHREVTEVEVEFPIYRQHDVGGDSYSAVIYTRIELKDAKGFTGPVVTQYSVKHTSGRGDESFELEIQTTGLSSGSGADYTLGRGEYACTRAEFEAVAAKAEEFLRLVRHGTK